MKARTVLSDLPPLHPAILGGNVESDDEGCGTMMASQSELFPQPGVLVACKDATTTNAEAFELWPPRRAKKSNA